MKIIFTLFITFLFSGIQVVFAQQVKQVSGVSKKVYISVSKKKPETTRESESAPTILHPPYLEISNYSFSDNNENNKIDAGETVKISFDLIERIPRGPGVVHFCLHYSPGGINRI